MKKLSRKSKVIAEILRHNPFKYGLDITSKGWVSVQGIINNVGCIKDISVLEDIVYKDEKSRYAFNEDKTLIRAKQGHSIPSIDIDFDRYYPTEDLYHGTSPAVVENILTEGLRSMKRQYVHLTLNTETAYSVGKRYSKDKEPVILRVRKDADIEFFISENNVVLTKKEIPAKYLYIESTK